MNKKQCLKVFGIVLVSFLLFNILPSSSSPVSPNVALDDLPSQATYTIKTDGVGNYWAVASNGSIVFESTNASYTIDNLIQTNTTIKFMSGTFPINYLLKVDVNRIHFIGNGWGTQFTIGASGGFNISSATLLRDISFENIWWEGGGTAIRAITSAMPTNTRIDSFVFSHNRVNNFYGTNAIGLSLCNLENSVISYNTFFRTYTAHIKLWSYKYQAGNIRVEGNEFYAGYNRANENIIQVVAQTYDAGLGNGDVGAIYSHANHYYSNSIGSGGYVSIAFNLTTIEGRIGGIHSIDDRVEGGAFIWTETANSTWNVNGINVKGLNVWADNAGVKLFNFDTYTKNAKILHSYLDLEGATSYYYIDNRTSSTESNEFSFNTIIGSSATFSPSRFTIVKGNTGIYSSYTVKTSGSSNIRNGNNLCNWGASNNNIANKTLYTVLNNDVYMTVSGGTVTSIQIYDPNGNLFSNLGTSTTGFLISYKFQLNITYSSAPTVNFLWKP